MINDGKAPLGGLLHEPEFVCKNKIYSIYDHELDLGRWFHEEEHLYLGNVHFGHCLKLFVVLFSVGLFVVVFFFFFWIAKITEKHVGMGMRIVRKANLSYFFLPLNPAAKAHSFSIII